MNGMGQMDKTNNDENTTLEERMKNRDGKGWLILWPLLSVIPWAVFKWNDDASSWT